MTGRVLFPVAQEEINGSGLDNTLYVTYNRTGTNQNWFTGPILICKAQTVCGPYNLYTHVICEGLYWFRRGFWSLGSHSQLWDCVTNLEIKFKRRRKFSVRCLMAAVGFWVSRSLDPGIKLSGALFLQSFEKKKEFMKLLRSEACHPASG